MLDAAVKQKEFKGSWICSKMEWIQTNRLEPTPTFNMVFEGTTTTSAADGLTWFNSLFIVQIMIHINTFTFSRNSAHKRLKRTQIPDMEYLHHQVS